MPGTQHNGHPDTFVVDIRGNECYNEEHFRNKLARLKSEANFQIPFFPPDTAFIHGNGLKYEVAQDHLACAEKLNNHGKTGTCTFRPSSRTFIYHEGVDEVPSPCTSVDLL